MLLRQSPTRLCASHQYNLSYPSPSRILPCTRSHTRVIPTFVQTVSRVFSPCAYIEQSNVRPLCFTQTASISSVAIRRLHCRSVPPRISGDDPFHLSIRVCIPSHESNFTQYVRSLRAHFARSTPFVTISTRIQPRIQRLLALFMDLVSLPCDNTRVPRALFNHNTNNALCIHVGTTRHPAIPGNHPPRVMGGGVQ
jgi:hypothetical protein